MSNNIYKQCKKLDVKDLQNLINDLNKLLDQKTVELKVTKHINSLKDGEYVCSLDCHDIDDFMMERFDLELNVNVNVDYDRAYIYDVYLADKQDKWVNLLDIKNKFTINKDDIMSIYGDDWVEYGLYDNDDDEEYGCIPKSITVFVYWKKPSFESVLKHKRCKAIDSCGNICDGIMSKTMIKFDDNTKINKKTWETTKCEYLIYEYDNGVIL